MQFFGSLSGILSFWFTIIGSLGSIASAVCLGISTNQTWTTTINLSTNASLLENKIINRSLINNEEPRYVISSNSNISVQSIVRAPANNQNNPSGGGNNSNNQTPPTTNIKSIIINDNKNTLNLNYNQSLIINSKLEFNNPVSVTYTWYTNNTIIPNQTTDKLNLSYNDALKYDNQKIKLEVSYQNEKVSSNEVLLLVTKLPSSLNISVGVGSLNYLEIKINDHKVNFDPKISYDDFITYAKNNVNKIDEMIAQGSINGQTVNTNKLLKTKQILQKAIDANLMMIISAVIISVCGSMLIIGVLLFFFTP